MATRIKNPITFETTFAEYTVDEIIGEGGAGRVYGGVDGDGLPIALKVLARDRASKDKRQRFKNEIAFLARNRHRNIVSVVDHGLAEKGEAAGPFYVMKRYDHSLRTLIGKIPPNQVLPYFSQCLDGLEAAHLQRVVHRDIKPENLLCVVRENALAVADFGIARFSEELLITLVETADTQRLANFQYAAPEQRARGQEVGIAADIYALGLILHEMFTGTVPHGTNYAPIESVAKEFAYLDGIVARMLRQDPRERPASIADLKAMIEMHHAEAVAQQRLSEINGTVIKVGEIDAPLAIEPPRLVGVDWRDGILTLKLDRPVTDEWVHALRNMGNYSSVWGRDPGTFTFRGTTATVRAEEHEAQQLVDHFKAWLPKASMTLKHMLEQEEQRKAQQRREYLRQQREAEEKRQRVLSKIQL